MSDRGGAEVPGAEALGVEHFTEDDIFTPEHNINDVTIPRRSNRVGSLTSVGREYQQGLAKSSCSRLKQQLDQQEHAIRDLLQQSSTPERIDHETLTYDKIMVALSAAYKKFIDLLEDDNEKEVASKSLAELRNDVSTFKEEIYAASSSMLQERGNGSAEGSVKSEGLRLLSEIGSGRTVIPKSSLSAYKFPATKMKKSSQCRSLPPNIGKELGKSERGSGRPAVPKVGGSLSSFPAVKSKQFLHYRPLLPNFAGLTQTVGETQQSRETMIIHLDRQEEAIKSLTHSPRNIEQVREEVVIYDKIFAEVVAVIRNDIQKGASDKERKNLTAVLDQLDSRVFMFKKEVHGWLYAVESPNGDEVHPSDYPTQKFKTTSLSNSQKKFARPTSIKSTRSLRSPSRLSKKGLSYISRRSPSSSSSTRKSSIHSKQSRRSYVEQKAEAAGLRAELSILKKKREIETELELLEYEQKIRRADAMVEVYAAEETGRDEGAGSQPVRAHEDRDIEDANSRKTNGVVCVENISEESKRRDKEVRGELAEASKFSVTFKSKEREEVRGKEELRGSNVSSLRKDNAKDEIPRLVKEGEVEQGNPKPKNESSDAGSLVIDPTDIFKSLMQNLQLQNAPKVDIDSFSGDILEYQYFIATFQEVVERCVLDQRGRLARLIQHTSGEAKELIRHCIHDSAESCYTNAMSLLEKQYGDPHRIAVAYLKQLRQWPTIKANDSGSFRAFNRLLIKLTIYKKNCEYLNELDSTDVISSLVLKIPMNLQDKWNHKVNSMKRKTGRVASFYDFADFFDMETLVTNDPVYSKEALYSSKDKKDPMINNRSTKTETGPVCWLCQEGHDLEDCKHYKEMSRAERLKFLYRQKLCYGCYQADHKADKCDNKRVCEVCNDKHPTGLHKSENTEAKKNDKKDEKKDDKKGDTAEGTTTTSTLNTIPQVDEVVSMCVIQVRLGHEGMPGRERLVYAVLDNCSKACFIREDLVEEMRLPIARSTSLKVKTMIGVKKETSSVIGGLTVRGTEEHLLSYPNSTVIQLPECFAKPEIPIDEDEIPTPERLRPWKHLHSIINKIPNYNPSIPVALLIGGNCAQALDPYENIHCVDGGPYAFRSQLGWCVNGALTKSTSSTAFTTSCRTTTLLTTDMSTKETPRHQLVIENEVEDCSIRDMVSKLYESEGFDLRGEEKALSMEDQKFLDIMKQNIRLDQENHYEVPLPLRNIDTKLPNNRNHILKRTLPLKRKFEKNKVLHKLYTLFMQNLIAKKFAQKCEESAGEEEEGVFYIPHHGVCHPKKPDKIRAVFDCSATKGSP